MQHDDIELLQQSIMHGGERAFEVVPLALKKVLIEKQWQKRTDKGGKPFASFEAFTTHRLWHGLETTIDDLRVHCRKHPEVERMILDEMEPGRKHGRPVKEDASSDKGSNPTFKGRGATYTLKRLKRDRPDLFARVVAGELSANAAAIEAGFRKRPPTPLERILKDLDKLTTAAELQRVRARLDELARRAA